MVDIEEYVNNGGNLYVSGPIGNKRLEKLLGVVSCGLTEQDFTYMSPTEEGKQFFTGFTALAPLTIPMKQYTVKVMDDSNCTVLATQTFPYTMPNSNQFAAIHSNPPGVYTDQPAAILKNVGKGKIIWTSAPIEITKPYMSRQVVRNIISYLSGELKFVSNAPKFIEVLMWNKEHKDYFAVINQQEESPIAPMYDITIDVKGIGKKARLAGDHTELKTETVGDSTRIYLPKLEVFLIIEVC
jgi:hypothetical protein